MDLHAVLMRDVRDRVEFRHLPAGAATLVGGLLHLHQ